MPFVLLANLLESSKGAEVESVALVKTLHLRHSTDLPGSPAPEEDEEASLAELERTEGGTGDSSLADRAGVYLGLLVRLATRRKLTSRRMCA